MCHCNNGVIRCEVCQGQGALPNGLLCLSCNGGFVMCSKCQPTGRPAMTREEREWVHGFYDVRPGFRPLPEVA